MTSTSAPTLIESQNLSHAWAQVFVKVLAAPKGQAPPVVLTIGGFEPPLPPEDPTIRSALDDELIRLGKNPCDVSAMVIFPYSLWVRRERPSCEDFSTLCLDRLFPRLKKLDRRNRHGTYFERMMRFEGARHGSPQTVNQLEHVIGLLRDRKRRPRHSALQIACFDPAKDHTGQPVRGFPCLQQISLSHDTAGGLALTGVYPSQYIFDRAYGNYLGLCHLGAFIARETGLCFRRMTCLVGRPELGDVSKRELRLLERTAKERLDSDRGAGEGG